jgi:phosphatidylserine/phosphatidylglycerophosphate/cardiolipin synthase-like enzyme
VRVRLIVSDWMKGREDVDALQSLDSLRGVEVRVSSVPEWSGSYIPYARVEHCKYAVVDSTTVWIGTSNWEPGYFTGSRNVSVTLRHAGLAREARAAFEASWRSPGAAPPPRGTRGAPRRHGEEPPPGVRKHGG